jgi:hypothetical protein
MRSWLLVLLALAVAGCTTYKLWTESDADEQAGTIQLSYEYRRFESPRVDDRGGNALANERCARSGYTGARRDGDENTCVEGTKSDCSKWRVTREYRCIRSK